MAIVCLSKHAARRANQRGVPLDLIDLLLTSADIDKPVGSGCTVLRISGDALSAMRGQLGATADRLHNLALIWSDRMATVVTIIRDHGGAHGRRYRRAA